MSLAHLPTKQTKHLGMKYVCWRRGRKIRQNRENGSPCHVLLQTTLKVARAVVSYLGILIWQGCGCQRSHNAVWEPLSSRPLQQWASGQAMGQSCGLCRPGHRLTSGALIREEPPSQGAVWLSFVSYQVHLSSLFTTPLPNSATHLHQWLGEKISNWPWKKVNEALRNQKPDQRTWIYKYVFYYSGMR